ncbi:hypothetical protein Peur_004588 [Populus x canadensis]
MLFTHQASLAFSASSLQYQTPKTHKADGSSAEDASVGFRAERVTLSLGSFLAEDVQGDFVDSSFLMDDLASVDRAIGGCYVVPGKELLTLSVGVLVSDLEFTITNVAVLRLFIHRVPTPCSGMELLWCSNVQLANARATGDSSSGTLSVLRSWRCCWCSTFRHELVNSSFRACGGCRMFPPPPS